MVLEINLYRYGFNGQEHSTEIDEENDYTAMFWEYDSRIGRRWNVDPVPKTSISGYEVLGNNPLMFVDPMGNDKKRVDTKNDFGGNSAWEVDEKGNSVGLGMSGAQQNVTVTAKARPKSLISQSRFGQSINESAKDYPAWHAGYLQYFDRKNAGSPTSQAGDKGYYNDHVASYARWYQAEEDSRAMQAWAVAIVMGPAALITAIESGGVYYAGQAARYLIPKPGFSPGGALADFVNQKLILGKSWKDYNYASTITNGSFGGGSVFTNALWGASGNLVDLSANGFKNRTVLTLTNDKFISFKAGFVGNLMGGGMTYGYSKFGLGKIITGDFYQRASGYLLYNTMDGSNFLFSNLISNKIEESMKK